MNLKKINIVAVILLAFADFIFGYIWFSILFVGPYRQGVGKTAQQLQQGPNALESIPLQFLGNLVMIGILAWILSKIEIKTSMQGMGIGLLIWLGFIAAFIAPLYAFQAQTLSYFAIVVGYPLISLITAGAILGVWKKN